MLARCLLKHFLVTASDDDYKEGMSILDKVAMFRAPGDSLNPYRSTTLRLTAMFSHAWLRAYRKPEDLEKAICRSRIWLDVMSIEGPERPMTIHDLSLLQGLRFSNFRVTAEELST